MPTPVDYALTALCVWREAEGEGRTGQIAVAWSIKNRSLKHNISPYEVVTKKWQFSSMTAPGDPCLNKFGAVLDPSWQMCQIIAAGVLDGTIGDPTNGSTIYYNPLAIKTTATLKLPDGREIAFPESWNPAALEFVTQLGKHYFFKEL